MEERRGRPNSSSCKRMREMSFLGSVKCVKSFQEQKNLFYFGDNFSNKSRRRNSSNHDGNRSIIMNNKSYARFAICESHHGIEYVQRAPPVPHPLPARVRINPDFASNGKERTAAIQLAEVARPKINIYFRGEIC